MRQGTGNHPDIAPDGNLRKDCSGIFAHKNDV